MADEEIQQCLPSGDAAIRLMRGGPNWPKNLAEVAGTFVIRSALVAGGLALAGARGKTLLTYTLAGTGAIEAWVLGWAAYQVAKER
jgi:hypothetical protein